MFKNYLRIAFRNLWLGKGFTLINIGGLAIGMASCLILLHYVSYQKSYDSFHDNANRIVRLRLNFIDQGKPTMQSATVYPGLPFLIKKEFSEVENICRLVDSRIAWAGLEPTQFNLVIANNQKDIKAIESKGYYADPSFLDMFTLPLEKGNRATALTEPNSMIISETMAHKYFRDEDPLDKMLTIREGGYRFTYQVKGVFKDYPANSHLSFSYLISYKTFDELIHLLGKGKEQDPESTLGWYDFYDYLQLRPGTDWKKLEQKLPAFCNRYLNNPGDIAKNSRQDIFLMPLRDIHLNSHYNEEAEVNGDGRSVFFLMIVAFIIVIIGWINYTNLSTARSLERAREVGVRKVLGALRADLIRQFLVESFLLNICALCLALIAAFFLTPSFNRMIGDDSIPGFGLPAGYTLIFSALFLTGTLLSGIYPAFILSGYDPVTVLKGAFKNTSKGNILRKSLIVAQFATSVILISGTLIVFQQVSFMRNQPTGINMNNTLVLNGPVSLSDSLNQDSYLSFRNEVLVLNEVKNMTASASIMGKEIYMTNGARLSGSAGNDWYTFYFMYADHDFVPAFGMTMKAGRSFSRSFPTDKKTVLINEEGLRLFGIKTPEEAITRSILYYKDTMKIIGVVKDFHQQGLNVAIKPIIFMLKTDAHNYYSVKFNTTDIHRAMVSIEQIWTRYYPADPFSYFFLDESFDRQYTSDLQFGKVFGLFAFLAILIACIGLLSLSAYNVVQRTKEIGIRKVLGASVGTLVTLLNKEYFRLVLMGILIGTPVAWFIMSSWLQGYAYRITIHWWVFLLAGSLGIAVALVTVSYHAIKAALANPTKSLRAE